MSPLTAANPRLLVVEDDVRVGHALVTSLGRANYDVNWVATGSDALTARDFDVVLLDLGLPDIDGLEVCRRMRERGEAAGIIAVTARGDSPERVAGLRTGADDYVVKPFSLAELTARIDAVWRRLPAELDVEQIHIGGLHIDRQAHEVRLDGAVINTTRKEFALLALLASNPERVWTREEILKEVWQTTWRGKSRTVDVHVAVLRQKLGDSGWIRTVHGVGYQLAEV